MHISFTLPMWALVGFMTVAYPSIGALMASFLIQKSNRKLPGVAVAILSFLWPATLAGTLAFFPLWLGYWFARNYRSAVVSVLENGLFRKEVLENGAGFLIGGQVVLTQPYLNLVGGLQGKILDQKSQSAHVELSGWGSHWVPVSMLQKV